MAIPSSRNELKEHCLRRLGKPVVDINVDDEQVEDRLDEALLYYRDYHFDGTERVLLKHQITSQDKTNQYILSMILTSELLVCLMWVIQHKHLTYSMFDIKFI